MANPTKVRLHLEFDYELFEADKETNPILRLYLTTWISPKIKELVVDKKGHVVTTLEWDYEGPADKLEERLKESALNIDVMDVIDNQKGQSGVNQAGCARVFLATLFGKEAKDCEYVPGFLPPTPEEEHDKAKFLFYCKKSSIRIISTPFMGADRPRAHAATSVDPSQWTTPEWDFDAFSGYISNCRDSARESVLPPTYEANAHIGMFEYVCRVGRLPVTAFIDAPLPPTTHAYYKNVLDLVLEERRMSNDDFFALKLDIKKDALLASYIVADVISAYACNGTYLLDEMMAKDGKKTPVEWFYHLRLRVTSWAEATGDCEDVANEIACMEAQEIKNMKRGVCKCVDKMQDVLNSFICTMTLCGVSNAEINLSDVKKAPKSMMAHMGAAMVPKWLFYLWQGKETIPEAVRDADQVLEASKVYNVVILEGTGFLRPEGVPKPSRYFDQEEELRQELERHARGTFRKLRHRYTYDAGGNKNVLFADDFHQSEFYKTVLYLATNEFSRKGWRVTLFAVSPSRSNPSVGVSFQDFAAGNEKIVLFAQPELSKEDYEKMKRLALDLPPVPPLDAPTPASHAWTLEKKQIMETLQQSLQERAEKNKKRISYQGGETANVELFVQYSTITPEFASDVVRAVADAKTHAWTFAGFEMQDRQLTDKMGSYRMVFKYF